MVVEARARAVNAFKEDELDSFFRFYLRAKFADTRNEGQRFDGDYHRAMFASDMDDRLGLLHSPAKVKAFLKGDFTYYTDLYVKLWSAYGEDQKPFRDVYLNAILDLDAPFHLVLSACVPNDPNEDEKIRTIGHEIDRFFSLLQLQSAYDSNEFADSLFRIYRSYSRQGSGDDSPCFRRPTYSDDCCAAKRSGCGTAKLCRFQANRDQFEYAL